MDKLSENLKRLQSEEGVVCYTFEDNSKQIIFTTLCGDKLPQGVFLQKGFFYDLAKNKYYPFRTDAIKVEIFFDLDDLELSEVDKFVNQML